MTREELETMAQMYYTKDEIKLLLKGFDFGIGHAHDLLTNAIENKQ